MKESGGMRILIVDDERAARRHLVRTLQPIADAEISEASSLVEARALLEERIFDVALLDLRLTPTAAEMDGLALVAEARARSIFTIVVSGSHEMEAVRTAMRMGANDYVLKDEVSEDLMLPPLRALERQRALEKEVLTLRSRQVDGSMPWLVGTSRPMARLREMIQRVSLSDRPVLITGPTGAGKELAVRAIHSLGAHPEAPLLDLNCGAFPEALIESQLFGHEKGAFTGADRKHDGFFAAVGEGTLFLDEVAELPLPLQAKLLRVLESGTFRPLGSSTTRTFRGRVVAATFAQLEDRVAEGRFREDLYYRLNVLEIRVPSLDERREDIPALLAHFAGNQSRPLAFTEEAIRALQSLSWPGNVRQLRNLVDRLAVFAPDGPVTAETVAELSRGRTVRDREDAYLLLAREILRRDEGDKLQLAETALIDEALRQAGGNKTAAAHLLGVHRKVVERRLQRNSVSPPRPERDGDDD